MTTSSPAASAAPPPTAEPQDPLPESNWVYRRWYIFAVTTITIIGIWFMAQAMVSVGDPLLVVGALSRIVDWLCLLLWFTLTYYLIAPSAEQVVKMLATLTAWKSGVSTTSTSRAVGPDGSMAEASASAGKNAPAAKADDPAIPEYAKP